MTRKLPKKIHKDLFFAKSLKIRSYSMSYDIFCSGKKWGNNMENQKWKLESKLCNIKSNSSSIFIQEFKIYKIYMCWATYWFSDISVLSIFAYTQNVFLLGTFEIFVKKVNLWVFLNF